MSVRHAASRCRGADESGSAPWRSRYGSDRRLADEAGLRALEPDSREDGFGKPNRRVFVEACRRLGTDPSRTAYVGDELDVDARAAVAAARAAGVHVVTSLAQLPDLLGL
ncbi:HAD family hydrolase [Cellulomonas sp. 179-A 9B4 NHS]|uniref:HAD family hydrolase n=1 Tax=Cellulomonas sp. 179-A 9B4 NHS TaxID=3142379 RepID=UPI0039A2836E